MRNDQGGVKKKKCPHENLHETEKIRCVCGSPSYVYVCRDCGKVIPMDEYGDISE